MNIILSLLKKLFALSLSVISMLVIAGPVTFSPVDAENVKLNFSIISDTHIGYVWDGAKTQVLVKGLKDMSNAQIKSDALIIAGDLTETGQINEYVKLGSALKLTCNADNMLLAMGNHDIRGIRIFEKSLQTYEYNAGKYFEFLSKTAGITESTVYYFRIINDCYFIILNTEDILGSQTHLSDTQLQWLDNLLVQASADDNPVFIVNHQPLSGVGDDAEKLEAVMQKYNETLDIFFISGHYHHGLNANSITNDGTIYFVDTPYYGESGTGFHAELYDNEIIFRARSFTESEWMSEYDRTIELISG